MWTGTENQAIVDGNVSYRTEDVFNKNNTTGSHNSYSDNCILTLHACFGSCAHQRSSRGHFCKDVTGHVTRKGLGRAKVKGLHYLCHARWQRRNRFSTWFKKPFWREKANYIIHLPLVGLVATVLPLFGYTGRLTKRLYGWVWSELIPFPVKIKTKLHIEENKTNHWNWFWFSPAVTMLHIDWLPISVLLKIA